MAHVKRDIEQLFIVIFSMIVTQCLCEFPFRNVSLPLEVRVADLVGRLTVEELVQQMSRGGGGGDGGPVHPIKRLRIGPYWWGTECIHGDAAGASTSFPQSIGLAAAFSPELIKEVASTISSEVRARNNDYTKKGIYSSHTGLNCFSPVINIMRHPLWGRNQETYGEDPYLSGVYAAHFVSGLKGDHPQYYRANAVCKHFDAYGGPEDLPQSRLSFNARVPEQDWHMTYLPQFKRCVDEGALGVMCSYNSINGIPACAHKQLLTDILRKSWNFTGFVISDSGALEFLILNHGYVLDIEKAAVLCAEAGVNLELHAGSLGRGVYDWLLKAYSHRAVNRSLLEDRVRPLFYTRMRLGEFDPPSLNPYLGLDLSLIQSPAHRALANQAAMQSLVLLKNDGVLPVLHRPRRIAIVGPFADTADQLMGSYAPAVDPLYMVTVAKGLSDLADIVLIESGCSNTRCLDYQPGPVEKAVTDADIVFLCLGTGPAIETENFDRRDMMLPGYQGIMMQDVINTATGKIVLLLFSGGPLDIWAAQASPAISAILQCFFPAQATGTALYNMVTYQLPEASPAARLPFTWYSSDDQVPSMVQYSMENRTYRYFRGDPLYPFGYGLSYTTFHYSDLDLTPTRVKAGQNVTVIFKIANTGQYSGREVYEVYISWLNATVATPLYQLVGFGSTMIDKSQSVSLNTTITSDTMAVWIDGKGFVIEPGEIVVYIGGQLPNQKTKVPSNVLKAVFSIYT